MASVITVFNIVAVALALIIVYFLIRIRVMIRNAPGARKDMNTMELIKNWREQKAKDAEYQNQLKQRAAEEAKPEIEKALVDKYKKEAIASATAEPKDRFKTSLKEGLGFDSDKAFSQQNMDRMVGRGQGGPNIQSGVDSGVIFSKDKIANMTQTGSINPDRIRDASGSLNWKGGVRGGLQSEMKFSGLKDAIGIKRQAPTPETRKPIKFR